MLNQLPGLASKSLPPSLPRASWMAGRLWARLALMCGRIQTSSNSSDSEYSGACSHLLLSRLLVVGACSQLLLCRLSETNADTLVLMNFRVIHWVCFALVVNQVVNAITKLTRLRFSLLRAEPSKYFHSAKPRRGQMGVLTPLHKHGHSEFHRLCDETRKQY